VYRFLHYSFFNKSRLRISSASPASCVCAASLFSPPPPLTPYPQNPYTKYKEVVRGKEARAAMPAYACDECKRFFDSVCADDPNGVFDKEFMIKNACRHRAKWKPEATPPEFWNLSFPDERDQHNFTQDKI